MNKKIFIISLIVIACDQLSKVIIQTYLHVNESVKLIDNFFSLTFIENSGAAWGIFNNYTVFLILISFLILLIIYRYMYTFKMNKKNILAFGLLVGGIIGNLLDRIILGYVRDFLDFYIIGYNFPVFNISDMCIVIGIFLLIIAIIRGEEVNAKNSCESKSRKNR